jgi:UDP-glucose 4-epimerase
MRKIIITGHRGFIGKALVSAIQEKDEYEVIGLSRSEGKNLLNLDSILKLPKVEKIVHLAATVGVMQSWSKPYDTYFNNIIPTLNVLEYARIQKVPVIYISSYVYGRPLYLPIDEAHPTNSTNPYAASKIQSEMLCMAYSKDFGIPVTILRPFNIYGPKQPQYSLIPHIINQLKDDQLIKVKDLSPKRDYLYIDDLTDAILKVIFSENKQAGSEVYNLGFGKSYSVQNIIDIISSLINVDFSVHSIEKSRPNEIVDCYSNSQKFFYQFNWKPKTNLLKGIRNLLRIEGLL